jgi:GNAT superfamily N-acetyltransferase
VSAKLRFESTDDPDRDVVRFLDDRLYEFNASRTGVDDGRLLAIFVRERGRVVAGLYGWTWGGCCHMKLLWVEARHRGKRLGTRLMAMAEREAQKRGASQMLLETHSFQAPEFTAGSASGSWASSRATREATGSSSFASGSQARARGAAHLDTSTHHC